MRANRFFVRCSSCFFLNKLHNSFFRPEPFCPAPSRHKSTVPTVLCRDKPDVRVFVHPRAQKRLIRHERIILCCQQKQWHSHLRYDLLRSRRPVVFFRVLVPEIRRSDSVVKFPHRSARIRCARICLETTPLCGGSVPSAPSQNATGISDSRFSRAHPRTQTDRAPGTPPRLPATASALPRRAPQPFWLPDFRPWSSRRKISSRIPHGRAPSTPRGSLHSARCCRASASAVRCLHNSSDSSAPSEIPLQVLCPRFPGRNSNHSILPTRVR